MFLKTVSLIIAAGFIVWFGHITLMLYSELQEEKKSTTEAGKLGIKMLVTIILVIGIILNT
jgi:hypothetical protein